MREEAVQTFRRVLSLGAILLLLAAERLDRSVAFAEVPPLPAAFNGPAVMKPSNVLKWPGCAGCGYEVEIGTNRFTLSTNQVFYGVLLHGKPAGEYRLKIIISRPIEWQP